MKRDEDRPSLSADARRLLHAVAWFEEPGNESSPYPTAAWVREIPLAKLARHAGLSIERAREAAHELANDREGIALERDSLVLRS